MERLLTHIAVERLAKRDLKRMPVDDYFVLFPFVIPLPPFWGFAVAGLDDGALLIGEFSIIGLDVSIPNPFETLGLGPVYVVVVVVSVGLPLVATSHLHFPRSSARIIASVVAALDLPRPEHRLRSAAGFDELTGHVARPRGRRDLGRESRRSLV